MLLRILEGAGILFVIVMLVTQVAIPLWKGIPLFPIFRKRWELAKQLEEAHEELAEKKIEQKIADTRGRTSRVNRSNKAEPKGTATDIP